MNTLSDHKLEYQYSVNNKISFESPNELYQYELKRQLAETGLDTLCVLYNLELSGDTRDEILHDMTEYCDADSEYIDYRSFRGSIRALAFLHNKYPHADIRVLWNDYVPKSLGTEDAYQKVFERFSQNTYDEGKVLFVAKYFARYFDGKGLTSHQPDLDTLDALDLP